MTKPKGRGNGTGSTYKRKDGRWVASITVAGRRVSVYRDNEREAKKALRLLIEARSKVEIVDDERLTVAAYLTRWLELARPSLRPRVSARYEQLVRLHAVPTAGRHRLNALKPLHLQELYAQKLAEGLHPTTVHHLHAVLHRAFSQAVRWDLLLRNPADRVDPPPLAPAKRPVLSVDEVARLLEAASSHRLGALITCAVTTGIRQGELLALRWADLDLQSCTATISATLYWMQGEYRFSAPKTATSGRMVRLPAVAILALGEHRKRQLEERLAAVGRWEDLDLVFANPTGGPVSANHVIRDVLRPLLQQAGCSAVRFHDLRHTFATLGLRQRVPLKIVSEALGHSRIAVTADLYSHVAPDMQHELAEAIDNLFPTPTAASIAVRPTG